MTHQDFDRAGLIRESFRIEGITAPECRVIFMDWALQLPDGVDPATAAAALLKTYDEPDHPMTKVLTEALTPAPRPRRRGGAFGRRS
ncbi:hypothetical protein [Psychromarinibacter sp. S121]|uniref:hypothetical protein n=1 Tax=Psychromarinibacter sp. S121 TaxID=3415127 RepID=UPI003C7AA2C3